MLRPTCRSVFLAAAVTFGGLLVQGCDAGFKYDLQGEATSTQPADTQSTDGSWSAALGELLWPVVTKHDTEYAPGYNERAYRSLDMGMGHEAVEQALGPPLEVKEFPDGMTYWYYSRHGQQFDSYFVRILGFNKEGSLAVRRSYFYVD
jgi:hypothetical protein